MPRVSKMLIVRSIYRTRQVPNENTKKGVIAISECGLCRVEFADLCDRRAACHVLGVPGQFAFFCVTLGNEKPLCYKYRTFIFRYVKYAYEVSDYEPYGT